MSGTSVVVVKRALLAALQTALPGVQVLYSWNGDAERECIYLGDAEFTQAYLAFAGGGRVPRTENVSAVVHVSVVEPGGTEEDTEVRAAEIGTLLEHALAGNPTQTAAALNFRVTGGDLVSGSDDENAISVLSYEVLAESHLT